MLEAPSAPPTDQPVPSLDSPAPEGDTAQDTQTAPTDPEARIRHFQAEFTTKAQEAATLRSTVADLEARLAAQAVPGTPETPEAAQRTSEVTRLRQQLEASEWARANGVYGPEIVSAYEKFQAAWASDQSPIGILTALEIYVEQRSKGATPAQAQAASQGQAQPTRAQAVAPRVDSNRSDASPDQLLAQQEQAKQVGGSQGLVAWLKAGGGRG